MTQTSTTFRRRRVKAKVKIKWSKILLGTISPKMKMRMTMMEREHLLTSSQKKRREDVSLLGPSVDVFSASMKCQMNLLAR